MLVLTVTVTDTTASIVSTVTDTIALHILTAAMNIGCSATTSCIVSIAHGDVDSRHVQSIHQQLLHVSLCITLYAWHKSVRRLALGGTCLAFGAAEAGMETILMWQWFPPFLTRLRCRSNAMTSLPCMHPSPVFSICDDNHDGNCMSQTQAGHSGLFMPLVTCHREANKDSFSPKDRQGFWELWSSKGDRQAGGKRLGGGGRGQRGKG